MVHLLLGNQDHLTITILPNRAKGQKEQFKEIVIFRIISINFRHHRSGIFLLHLYVEEVGLNFHTNYILRRTFVWQTN